jgi:threonine dehydratase
MTAIAPGARVIAVQAKGSPAMVESFHAGRSIECPANTIADGLICRVPAALALAALLAYVDDVRLTSDDDLLSCVRTLAELGHVLVEPAGAAALAGALGDRQAVRGRRVVLVLTGGNVTLEQLSHALSLPPLLAAPWQEC